MTNATARKSKGGDADELERMIHAWTQAVQVRDADAAVADYADDVRNFDLAPPLQHGGRKTIRDNLKAGSQHSADRSEASCGISRSRPAVTSPSPTVSIASMASARTAAKRTCGFA